jgi:hypothetical protein
MYYTITSGTTSTTSTISSDWSNDSSWTISTAVFYYPRITSHISYNSYNWGFHKAYDEKLEVKRKSKKNILKLRDELFEMEK